MLRLAKCRDCELAGEFLFQAHADFDTVAEVGRIGSDVGSQGSDGEELAAFLMKDASFCQQEIGLLQTRYWSSFIVDDRLGADVGAIA